MLALAIGMGWFATSFNATVVQSQLDRAEYKAGTDLRLTVIDTQLGRPKTQIQEFYDELAGVNMASIAFRSRINASVRPGRSVFGEILGVDAQTFGLTSHWRSDLGVLFLPSVVGGAKDFPGRFCL